MKKTSSSLKNADDTPNGIRCVTFNLKGLSAEWSEVRRSIAVEQLKALRPDVVCLQEVSIRYLPEAYDQALDLGTRIGLPYLAFCPYGNPIEIMSFEQGGLATLSRWPFQGVRFRRLPPGHEQPFDSRVALITSLALPGTPLHIVNTHLSWRPEESYVRLVQCGLILDFLMKLGLLSSKARTVFAGDFNAEEREPCIQYVIEQLKDSFKEMNPKELGHTVSKINPLTEGWDSPDRRLDYLFSTPSLHIDSSRVVLNVPKEGGYASDHFGLMTDLSWNQL